MHQLLCYSLVGAAVISLLLVPSVAAADSDGTVLPKEMDYFNPGTWEEILQSEDSVPYPIVFIHGIVAGFDHWQETAETISGGKTYRMRYGDDGLVYHTYCCDGVPRVWNVSYYTCRAIGELISGNLTEYANRLQLMLKAILKMTGQPKVVLVAHSMGGLVARKCMTLDSETWDSVHRLLTVGTPHEGVGIPLSIFGQVADMKSGSEFLQTLEADWNKMATGEASKWGVVGAIDRGSLLYRPDSGGNATDSAGPGFVEISSAIPYGEWKDAIGEHLGQPAHNTQHFGFRLAVDTTHMGLLSHPGTMKGIHWAISREELNMTCPRRSWGLHRGLLVAETGRSIKPMTIRCL